MYDSKQKNVELFANILKELTGDFVTEIKCEDIHKKKRHFYDEVIYFGPKEDFEKNGTAELLPEFSLIDRYSFTDSRVGFYYNNDEACKKEYNLQ